MSNRLLNVTDQILDTHRLYGGSDNTNSKGLSANRSLNYANGGSIQKAESESVTNIPVEIRYTDSVGLFGPENYFVKLDVQLENPLTGVYELEDYQPAVLSEETVVPTDEYTLNTEGGPVGQAYIDYDADLLIINTYEPAVLSTENIAALTSKFFKVELINEKTGNKYVDCWLDVRLYNRYYEEHPYDVMYIKYNEPFYIGFHARNTRNLPYNVLCVIGRSSVNPELGELFDYDDFDHRYLATKP